MNNMINEVKKFEALKGTPSKTVASNEGAGIQSNC